MSGLRFDKFFQAGREITRLKDATRGATVNWLLAEFDGEVLHLLPDDPEV